MSHSYSSSSGEVLSSSLTPSENTAPPPASEPAAKKPGVLEQFIKFCVVGFSSTIISLSVVYFLLKVVKLQSVLHNLFAGNPSAQQFIESNHLYIQAAGTFGFIFGVANGFFWNSKWTFPQQNSALRRVQCFRFFSVNVVGFMLNNFVVWIAMQVLANGVPAKDVTWQPGASILIAIFLVSFFNFFMNRLWTFKKPKARKAG